MQNVPRSFCLAILAGFFVGTTACVHATELEVPLPPPQAPLEAPLEAPDTISVGIAVRVPRVRIAAPEGLLAWNSEGVPHILPAGIYEAAADTTGVRWWFDTSVASGAAAAGPSSSRWDVRPLAGETLSVQGLGYRGSLALIVAGGTETQPRLTAINSLPLEDYLRGVVAREIGTTRPEAYAAIQAQAVAARTYAVRNLGRRRALGFDLMASHDDQVYGGASAEYAITDRAVLSTAGEILVHGGDLAEAFYHSTCGGHTTSRAEAWSGDREYLRGVPDLVGDTPACTTSRYFHWRERYEGETLARLMAPSDTFTWVLEGRDTSGRMTRLTILRGESATTARGDAIRWMLRRPSGEPLRSTLFDMTWESGAIVLTGRGWGHGIGMCQVGAQGRARAGEGYAAILRHYYPGTEIRRLVPRGGGLANRRTDP